MNLFCSRRDKSAPAQMFKEYASLLWTATFSACGSHKHLIFSQILYSNMSNIIKI